ncbi:mitochondrial import inner membrane translocase subunit Tim54 [Lipomyces oligophaga]|uniref:mitochondrial import inner membrane translocase subunit Tim54 n=1 Tax=Lipomyces oligophaga TaxID=45792 RepID=UPI0034CEECEC
MSTETPKQVPKEPSRNPVFEAMGLPRFKLPGRRMTIFLSVVFGISGAIYYDRKYRRENREKWKDRVAYMAKETLDWDQLPRKVTVFISPPPGDHMDISMEHFRQYIKPILTSAAVDWELVENTRKNEIRYHVAEDIRRVRRGEPDPAKENKLPFVKFDEVGGVICIGRGAYKEYLRGLNEGWLGPATPPAFIETHDPAALPSPAEPVVEDPSSSETAAESPAEAEPKTEEPKVEKKPVPPQYILPEDYSNAATTPELARITEFQPIMYIPHPHILGFRHTPIRTYRFFTRRNLADRVGAYTAAVVLNQTRPFISRFDCEAGIEEESEWPNKWKEESRENNSVWTQDVVVDERIAERLRIYKLPSEYKNEANDSD